MSEAVCHVDPLLQNQEKSENLSPPRKGRGCISGLGYTRGAWTLSSAQERASPPLTIRLVWRAEQRLVIDMSKSFQKEIREGGEEGRSQDGLHSEDQGLLVHRNCEDSFTLFLIFFFFLLLCVACGILVPWPGIEPVPPVTGTQSLNLWSRREAPPSSWLCREESGAHLTPEVTASNCRWWPLGGKLLPLQGGVLEHCLQVTWPRLCPDGWTVPGVPLWAGQPPLQERSPLHYPAVSGVFLLGMFDSSFLLVMLRVNFLLSSRQVITE